MADSHPKNLDLRPKRRRDEENPYEIYTAGINTAHPRYFLAFTDGSKVKRWMEIDKPLFDAFNEFELDDLSFFNEVDRPDSGTGLWKRERLCSANLDMSCCPAPT